MSADVLQPRTMVGALKTRASAHDPEIREFHIRPEGIVLGDVFDLQQRFD